MKDRNFINQVYWITAFMWTLAAACAFYVHRPLAGINISIGAMLSLIIFASLVWMGGAIFRGRKTVKVLWLAAAVKYPLLAVLLYGLVHWEAFSIAPFVGGFMLLYSAIVINAIRCSISEEDIHLPEGMSGIEGRP